MGAIAALGWTGWLVLISYVLHARRAATRAERLARLDPLTEVGNRRAFDEVLGHEMRIADREGTALSLCLVDLDNLKQINDRFGHLEGDRCLQDVARTIRSSVRAGDSCFRWGGDEFAVLLPDTDRDTAFGVLQRTAERLGASCRAPHGATLEFSFGAAEVVPDGSSEDLLSMADLALMEQKLSKRR